MGIKIGLLILLTNLDWPILGYGLVYLRGSTGLCAAVRSICGDSPWSYLGLFWDLVYFPGDVLFCLACGFEGQGIEDFLFDGIDFADELFNIGAFDISDLEIEQGLDGIFEGGMIG